MSERKHGVVAGTELGRAAGRIRHQVECSPCFLRDCPLDFRCMKEIPKEEVVSALLLRCGTSANAPDTGAATKNVEPEAL